LRAAERAVRLELGVPARTCSRTGWSTASSRRPA